MDGIRVSDFSIARILSPQLGSKSHMPDPRVPEIRGGFGPESGSLRPAAPVPVPLPVPVPVPVLGCLQYRGMSCGDAFYAFGTADFSGLYPNCGVCKDFRPEAADAQPLGPGAAVQSRQKARMRTVFTDSQTKRLEALFELTDYPTLEARAELAWTTGLSEETVRVWFKNRRARRKRQRSRPSSPTRRSKEEAVSRALAPPQPPLIRADRDRRCAWLSGTPAGLR